MFKEGFIPYNKDYWDTPNVIDNLATPDGVPVRVGSRDFLRRLRRDFGINRIFYPGVGYDTQLEDPFGKNRIFPLDRGRYTGEGMRNYVRGQMENSPFLDGVFDAVFLHDVGANEEELTDVLRTLHPNGIVIHSYSDCCDYDLDLLEVHPQMEPVELSYWNEDFSIFRKREETLPTEKHTPDDEPLPSNPTPEDLWNWYIEYDNHLQKNRFDIK